MKRPTNRRELTKSELQDAERLKNIYTNRKSELAATGGRLTQEELASRCGWSGQSTVSQFMNGLVALSLEALISLSRELNVSPDEISPTLAAKHGLTRLVPQLATFQNVTTAEMGSHKVPVLSYVQAGNWQENNEYSGIDGGYEYVTADLDDDSCAFAVWIQGNSMTPEFNEGDLIIVDPDVVPLPGDFVVAKNGGEECTFKKYRPRGHKEDGSEIFELVPLNEDYPTLRSETCPIRIIGTMIEHRKFRRRKR